VLALALPAAAGAAGRHSVAMLGVNGGAGFDSKVLGTVEELLLSALEATGRFEVTSRSDISQLIGFERQKQLLGCTDTTCVAELAGALGVAFVASADLGRLGDVSVLSLKLIDVRRAKVVARVTKDVPTDAALVQAAREAARELAAAVPEPAPPKPAVPAVAPPPAPVVAPAPPAPAKTEPAPTPVAADVAPPVAVTEPSAPAAMEARKRLAIRAGLSPMLGVLGVGAEYRFGVVGLALGTGTHVLAGGLSFGPSANAGGWYVDVHAVLVRSLFVTLSDSGVGAGITAGWDWRFVPWLSVKTGAGVAATMNGVRGQKLPLVIDVAAGPVW